MDRPNENLLSRLEQSLRQSRAARMHLAARLRELEAEADSVRAELAEMDLLASQTEAAIYRLVSTVLASNNLSFGLPSDAELEAAMNQSSQASQQHTRSSAYGQPPPEYGQQPPTYMQQSSAYPHHQAPLRAQSPVTHTQPGPHTQSGPHMQAGSHTQPGPHTQPGSHTQLGSHTQPGPHMQAGSHTQPGSHMQPVAHTQSGPHTQRLARTQSQIDRRAQIPTVRDNVEVLSDRFMDRTIPQAVTLLLREEGGPLHVNELYNRLLEGGFRFTGQNPTISVAVSLNRNTRFRKVAPGTFDLVMRDASSKAS